MAVVLGLPSVAGWFSLADERRRAIHLRTFSAREKMIDPDAVVRMAAEYTAAWNSKSAEAVAPFYAKDGEIIINNGDPWIGRARVQDMAAGFFADVPDLTLSCDDVRCAGAHVVFVWTFTGHDATTGRPLNIRGWEEWEVGDDLKVLTSRGWFDADDYARQAAGM